MSERNVSPMGIALRYLRGDQNMGEGPIEVKVRLTDFDVVTLQGPGGQPTAVPATPLIGFTAMAFREVQAESDVWEFRVMAGEGIKLIYLDGSDLLLVRAPSKVM